jgi:hypothetical protein
MRMPFFTDMQNSRAAHGSPLNDWLTWSMPWCWRR